MKNLGKIRNFRAATMINCKKLLPNLGEDLLFKEQSKCFSNFYYLKNTLIVGQKLRNIRLIPCEDLFFMIWDEIWSSSENFRQLFCPIRKILKNDDLNKCHKIRAKLH